MQDSAVTSTRPEAASASSSTCAGRISSRRTRTGPSAETRLRKNASRSAAAPPLRLKAIRSSSTLVPHPTPSRRQFRSASSSADSGVMNAVPRSTCGCLAESEPAAQQGNHEVREHRPQLPGRPREERPPAPARSVRESRARCRSHWAGARIPRGPGPASGWTRERRGPRTARRCGPTPPDGTPGARRRAAATTSRVRSSVVGPSPPVTITRSASSAARASSARNSSRLRRAAACRAAR